MAVPRAAGSDGSPAELKANLCLLPPLPAKDWKQDFGPALQGSRGIRILVLMEEGQDRAGGWAASGACSPLGDLLVAQLQLRLQVLLWEQERTVSTQGTPGKERERGQGHPGNGQMKGRPEMGSRVQRYGPRRWRGKPGAGAAGTRAERSGTRQISGVRGFPAKGGSRAGGGGGCVRG